jgi:hypothetical protein
VLFRDQIQQIRWKYTIDDKTSNYTLEDPKDTIIVIRIMLKQKLIPKECLLEIDKSIPSKVIFELIYEESSCYVFISQYIYNSEFDQDMEFNLISQNIKDLYDNIRRSIISSFNYNLDIEEILVKIHEEKIINKEIEVLKLKIKNEKQPNRQLDMKRQLNELLNKWNG